MKVRSRAHWEGSFKEGCGYIHSGRGAYHLDYTYKSRIGDSPTTNPEELIASAHAACFAMALRFSLEKAKIEVNKLEVTCELDVQELKILESHLTARIGARRKQEEIKRLAEEAKTNCPISGLLNCPITLDVQFTENVEINAYN